jgi:hypothetical protein
MQFAEIRKRLDAIPAIVVSVELLEDEALEEDARRECEEAVPA